ncbi:hypothetical protein K227x_61700 [Rubripirellula lacrimiformis]|uniref:Pheromone autoinducer 2 transporter n=1 Tax=Rubripirellula lacrimiformis TaxID=1930273 RepID=A0A517NKT0_9BACT|nr:hypothetical protein K227x_61700 [Rubripirellula lacrimiformis]
MNRLAKESSDRSSQLVRDTLTRIALVTACGLAIAIGFFARDLWMLIFGAALVSVVINRSARMLGKITPASWTDQFRVGLILLMLVIAAAITAVTFANSASQQVVTLTDRISDSSTEFLQSVRQHPIYQRLQPAAENPDGSTMITNAMPDSGKSLGMLRSLFTSTFGLMTDFLVLVILSAYFCVSPSVYRDGALKFLPVDWRDRARGLMTETGDTLSRWMVGRLIAMSLVGICFSIGLAVIGIPMPIQLGIFAGLVTFIPNLGALAAVVPALLLAFSQSNTAMISVIALYGAIQFAESYLITPLVQQHQVALPPAIVILSQIMAGILFGFWGIVFATPLAAAAMVWIRGLYLQDYLQQDSQ